MGSGTLDVHDYIFAVVVRRADSGTRAICGTGFMVPGGVFVTCWHCVRDPLPSGETYVAARRQPDGRYEALELSLLAQDQNGADLALARLPDDYRPPDLFTELGGVEIIDGMDVGTFGCSLPEQTSDGSFITHFRTLRGYVTRAIVHERPGWGPTPSLEVDMPAPEGVSGAPLMVEKPTRLVGVVYGAHQAYMIDEFATVDPITGESRPEVRRIYTFGLALTLGVLKAARGPATDGKPLAEYVTAHLARARV